MTNQALARKWRPQCFSTFVGQKHVVQALTNAISQQRLHHAYLFTGTRGIGKTTIARIFAKSLNCQQGIVAPPCLECDHCQAVSQGQFIDLIEVDAASKTKVEDTRELLQNAQFSPHTGRFKIFLIDEVHMLSGHSFNALLKTLEEPPSHVKFLFATTDPEKLPITVLSRCLQFHLAPLTTDEIHTHLAHVLTQESIAFEAEALALIAELANGSLRDALSCTDQLIALGNGQITEQHAMQLLGLSSQHQVERLLSLALAGQVSEALQHMEILLQQGVQPSRTLKQMMVLLHNGTRNQLLGLDVAFFNHIPADNAWFKLSQSSQQEAMMLHYQIALAGERDLHLNPNPQIGLEMTLLRMLAFKPKSISHLIQPKDAISTNPSNLSRVKPSSSSTKSEDNNIIKQPHSPVQQHKNEPMSSHTSHLASASQLNAETWPAFALSLKVTGLTKALVNHLAFESCQNNHLVLTAEKNKKSMINAQQTEKIQQALDQTNLGLSVELKVTQTTQQSTTAHQVQQHEVSAQEKSQQQQAHTNPHIKQILNEFSGKVVEITTNQGKD